MSKISFDDVEDGKKYRITLSDCYGEYTQVVTASFYKKGSTKQQLKQKYRFIDEYNQIIPRRYAESIESINQ